MSREANEIELLPEINEHGYICFRDARTGRKLGFVQRAEVIKGLPGGDDGVQVATITVIVDPRICTGEGK